MGNFIQVHKQCNLLPHKIIEDTESCGEQNVEVYNSSSNFTAVSVFRKPVYVK